jgi:hypothetical protein
MATTITKPASDKEPAEATTSERGRFSGTATMVSGAADAAASAAGSAIGAAGGAAARLPDLADRGRIAFEDANRRVHGGTDEMLTVGTAASFGLAVGLLIGGASRVLVAAAFVPVAMMGLTLLDRIAQGRLRIPSSASTGSAR